MAINVLAINFRHDDQGRSQEFDLGGYKLVKETKQPHKTVKADWFGGVYTDIPPVANAPDDNSQTTQIWGRVTWYCAVKTVSKNLDSNLLARFNIWT